jgi:hypothetical protein
MAQLDPEREADRAAGKAALILLFVFILLFILLFGIVPAAHGVSLVPGQPAKKHHRQKKQKQPSWFDYRVFIPSHENLLAQNAAIDEMGLPRIRDDQSLKSLEAEAALVPITDNEYVRVSPKLETKRRYCRPWVDAFLQELGRDYYTKFGEPIQVNSAVRTVKTQSWLLRWNHNAAPAHGETASAHLAGVAVDLQRRGLTREEIRFIQKELLTFAKINMVIVEEELKQPCFHVVVTEDYPVPPKINVVISEEEQRKVLNGILNDPTK